MERVWNWKEDEDLLGAFLGFNDPNDYEGVCDLFGYTVEEYKGRMEYWSKIAQELPSGEVSNLNVFKYELLEHVYGESNNPYKTSK